MLHETKIHVDKLRYLLIQPISESAMGSLRAGFKKAGQRSHDQT